jgi:hypothetical protein
MISGPLFQPHKTVSKVRKRIDATNQGLVTKCNKEHFLPAPFHTITYTIDASEYTIDRQVSIQTLEPDNNRDAMAIRINVNSH